MYLKFEQLIIDLNNESYYSRLAHNAKLMHKMNRILSPRNGTLDNLPYILNNPDLIADNFIQKIRDHSNG